MTADRLHARSPSCLHLALAIAAGATVAVAQVAAPADAELVAAFARQKVPEQERIAARIRADVERLEGPYATSLRASIADAALPATPRLARLPLHKAKQIAAEPFEPSLPFTVVYAFGRGAIEPAASGDPARRADVLTALRGALPGSDRALAALLRRIDRDTSADRFAAFLESWRNGDESFYRALDRTAGTPQSVFFFDAMLGDFATKFGFGGGARGRGLQATHDALHDAFLAYRQYRALREALAWSLLLPPDLPLPAHLARYEQAPEGTYALREQVQMVLAAEGFDVRKVADLVVASAAPLPAPLWSAPYEPLARWHEVFDARLDAMIEASGDTDAFLAAARQKLAAHAEAIRAIARDALASRG